MRFVNLILYIGVLVAFILASFSGRKGIPDMEGLKKFAKGRGYILIILLVFNTLSLLLTFQKEEGDIYIERAGYGKEDKTVGIWLESGEQAAEESIDIRSRKLTDEEADKKMSEAFEALAVTLSGENENLSHVETDLDFSLDGELFPFDADFIPADYRLINGEGYVRNKKEELFEWGYSEEDLKKGITTKVKVVLWYGNVSREQDYELVIYEKTKTEEEQRFEKVMEALKEEEQKTLYDEGVSLPSAVDGISIRLSEKSPISPVSVLAAGLILIVMLILRDKENEKRTEREHQEKLMRSYPWFVNEMLLLLGAGMQVKQIFATMIGEQKENDLEDDRQPLINELVKAKYSMDNGMGEEQVYYQLGRRLKLSCYIKLMSLLEQNVTRGTKGLSAIFEAEELAALEERKNLAKRYGEEAGTKLLGPMIILLIVVMLIIMIPAFLGFSL